jgi:cytochrome c oxidase accessory protein FixG
MAEPQNFRDHIPSITDTGNKRKWMYPQIIKGKLYHYRDMVSYALLALLFSSPFIKINGEQMILLNVMERKFVFFGIIFWPQDFYLFVLALLTFMVFIVMFTAIFGRVWCGWACPQTIFMEMVFRKIENWIEGDWIHQQKLNQSALSFEKIAKKTAKHSIFIVISFLISNIFLAYIIGSEELIKIISEPLGQHLSGFISILIFTMVFYIVFSYLRELVCTVICPYGRLQGVLLDNQSMIVAYDYERGEPRGKILKNTEQQHLGDCIDCKVCVHVCPTGIDIRNGTQLECINCTACIDACDMVMEKINRPSRLIGFMSEDQIKSKSPFKFSRKVYAYSVVLLILFSVLSFMLIRRSDIETTVLRAGGTLYQLRDNGTVSNLYNVELVNKTTKLVKFEMRPKDQGTEIQFIRKEAEIKKGSSIKLTFFVIRPQKSVDKYKSEIVIEIWSEGKLIDKIKTNFIAPPNE